MWEARSSALIYPTLKTEHKSNKRQENKNFHLDQPENERARSIQKQNDEYTMREH